MQTQNIGKMNNIKDFLASMGFGKNETEIYSALVEMGTSSALSISKRTKIHRSNIYDALRKLIQHGLVYEINNPTKLFYARPPKSLLDYLKNREAELKEIIKDFETRHPLKENENKAGISKGTFALREAVHGLLETGKQIDVYGIPEHASEIIGPMLKEFHKERIKRKILMRHIYNSSSVERVKFLNKMKYTEARVLPAKYDSIATTNVSGDRVVMILWNPEITVIEIRDSEIAKSYANYFDILWKNAKPVV